MAKLPTKSIGTLKPPKQPNMAAAKLPALHAPSPPRVVKMSTAAPTIASPKTAKAASARPRSYSDAMAKAASSSGSGAAGVEPGKTGWRNRGRTLRPQQDSPLGMFSG